MDISYRYSYTIFMCSIIYCVLHKIEVFPIFFSFSDRWNTLDVITMVDLLVIFVLRLVTSHSSSAVQNRTLAVANYLYGLNAMLLTLRVLGSILESKRKAGVMQIALFRIVGNVKVIFWQFSVAVLAFSMAITKIFMADRSYDSPAVGRENEWYVSINHSLELW